MLTADAVPPLAAWLPSALLALAGAASAAVIGFAAHRASLCNVRAVAEWMTGGGTHMLRSLLQAVLWSAWLTGVLGVLFGIPHAPVWLSGSLVAAALGGALFGIGAALNAGCSLSTLTRLADGDLGMLATLLGFVAGVAAWAGGPIAGPARPAPVPVAWDRIDRTTAALLLLVLTSWGLWAGRQALRRRRPSGSGDPARPPAPPGGPSAVAGAVQGAGWRGRWLAARYPLATAAAVLGLAAGLLYAVHGPWSYSNALRQGVLHAVGQGAGPVAWQIVLTMVLLGGMSASAWQRRSLRWRTPRDALTWARHAAGGLLMGGGAAAVPGGNDSVLLNGLPTLAPAALLAYGGMLAGIALALAAMRRLGRHLPRVHCSPQGGDQSTSEEHR